MNAYITFILVLLLSFTETRADLTKLMERLNSQTWPWFGDRYPSRCPKSEADWPRCYNARADTKSSVLQRIGVHSDIKPTIELEVIFSAPAETVEICGKTVNLPEVKPFKLNPNGFAIKELLSQGAEIYRKMPLVKWSGTLTEEHSLLFIDAGLIRLRGYIGNVRTDGTHFLGEVLWPYTPPASPNKLFRNPIVILLVQESLSSAANTQQQMLDRGCIVRGISKDMLRGCLGYFSDILGAARVKAVQVFYTDGSSEYEMYRTCTEGTFCDIGCTVHFSSYAEQLKPDVKFVNVAAALVDMYVNLEVMSVRRFSYTACCNFVVVEPYTFRAKPGENILVDDTAKLHQPHRLEFSGGGNVALDVEKVYSVLLVDPDATYPEAKQLPYGHLWIANIKYQDHYTTGTTIMPYAGPTPPNRVEHTYYILLFAHKKPVGAFPIGFYHEIPGCDRRCMWNFSKIPADFELKGISRFRATTDNYTLQLVAGDPSFPCAPAGTGFFPELPAACQPKIVEYQAVPSLAIKLTYEGNLMESADPANPDFDYEDGTPKASSGNVLTSWGSLWMIAFGVRSLAEVYS